MLLPTAEACSWPCHDAMLQFLMIAHSEGDNAIVRGKIRGRSSSASSSSSSTLLPPKASIKTWPAYIDTTTL